MKIKTLLCCAAAMFLFCSCSLTYDIDELMKEETQISPTSPDREPEIIVNPDFRKILWGMNRSSIEIQEGRFCDSGSSNFILFEDVVFAGKKCRLCYYFSDNKCDSAEYFIPVGDNSAESVKELTDYYLSELYEEGTPQPDGSITYKYDTFDIRLYEDSSSELRAVFSKPENYKEDRPPAKTIIFENNEPVTEITRPKS